MKILRPQLALSLLCLSLAPAAWADTVISVNIVGYINRQIFAGDNLIANQLGTTNDTLDYVLATGVLDGSTLTKWDPVTEQFLPASIYDGATATWSINYSLTYGEGALLHSPSGATNTFVGEVDPALMVMDGNGYINISFANWHPNYADGLHLLSCPVPLEIATFQQVVGRDPLNGEWVETLNEATQTYAITTFHTGIGWDNGEPALGVGQAAFFNFGPVLVPEPSVLALASLGAVTLFRFGRNCRRAAPSAGGRAQEQ